MVLRALEGLHKRGKDGFSSKLALRRNPVETAGPVNANGRIYNRLRGKTVLATRLDPEEISGQMKSIDLSAAVAKELGHSHGAGHDLGGEFRDVSFGENLLILLEGPYYAFIRCLRINCRRHVSWTMRRLPGIIDTRQGWPRQCRFLDYRYRLHFSLHAAIE